MRATAWPATDVGRVRDHNEDSHWVDHDLGLFLVADGMGGHAGGAYASKLCVEVVAKVVRRGAAGLDSVAESERDQAIAELLAGAAAEASARIFDQAAAEPRLQGMGTTLCGLFIYGKKGYVVHVGDSRVYLFRGVSAQQLTNDHSWLNEQVQAGLLSEEEAAESELKHIITRSVGFERDVHADILQLNVDYGDSFLLCSDGMCNYLSVDELAELARDHYMGDLAQVCVDVANERGGDDNITVLTVQVANDTDLRKVAERGRRTLHETMPFNSNGGDGDGK